MIVSDWIKLALGEVQPASVRADKPSLPEEASQATSLWQPIEEILTAEYDNPNLQAAREMSIGLVENQSSFTTMKLPARFYGYFVAPMRESSSRFDVSPLQTTNTRKV